MSKGLFYGVSLKVRFTFFAILFAPIAAPFILMSAFGSSVSIDRGSVFGCYAAAGAPDLLIRNDAIHIVEPAGRTFTYVAEASKQSYQLNVSPALALVPLPNGTYEFSAMPGIGFFWPLLSKDGKNRGKIRHPEEYAGQFKIIARDGADVVYSRTKMTDGCRSIR